MIWVMICLCVVCVSRGCCSFCVFEVHYLEELFFGSPAIQAPAGRCFVVVHEFLTFFFFLAGAHALLWFMACFHVLCGL